MNKGQAGVGIALAAAMLVTMVIGIGIVDDIASGFCQCDGPEYFNETLIVTEWVNTTCIGEKCDTGWDLVCNDTELEPGVEYNVDDCNLQLTNATWNDTSCLFGYEYEGSYYHGTDTLGLIMCNIALIMATLGLTLAGAWLYMKGGF